jgi:hypothetical protein
VEENIIQLNFGGRYQIIGGEVYSLNYAERGMSGSSMGKKLPPELAKNVLETYEQQQNYKRLQAARPRPKKEIAVKTKSSAEKPKKFRKKKVRTVSTGVKLGGLVK